MGLFEVYPVGRHHGLVEGEAWFRTVPVDEFTDRMVIRALGAVGGQTVKDCCFRLLEIRQFQDGFGTEVAFLVGHPNSLNDTQSRRAQAYAGAFTEIYSVLGLLRRQKALLRQGG